MATEEKLIQGYSNSYSNIFVILLAAAAAYITNDQTIVYGYVGILAVAVVFGIAMLISAVSSLMDIHHSYKYGDGLRKQCYGKHTLGETGEYHLFAKKGADEGMYKQVYNVVFLHMITMILFILAFQAMFLYIVIPYTLRITDKIHTYFDSANASKINMVDLIVYLLVIAPFVLSTLAPFMKAFSPFVIEMLDNSKRAGYDTTGADSACRKVPSRSVSIALLVTTIVQVLIAAGLTKLNSGNTKHTVLLAITVPFIIFLTLFQQVYYSKMCGIFKKVEDYAKTANSFNENLLTKIKAMTDTNRYEQYFLTNATTFKAENSSPGAPSIRTIQPSFAISSRQTNVTYDDLQSELFKYIRVDTPVVDTSGSSVTESAQGAPFKILLDKGTTDTYKALMNMSMRSEVEAAQTTSRYLLYTSLVVLLYAPFHLMYLTSPRGTTSGSVAVLVIVMLYMLIHRMATSV